MLVDIVRTMQEKGNDVDILTIQNNIDNLEALAKNLGIKVYSLGSGNLYNPIILLKLRNYIGRYDITHVHLFPSQYWVAIYKRFFDKKAFIITTEHSTFNRRRKYNILKHIEKYIYRSFNCIITISEATYESLQNWIGKNTANMVVINNGIDLEKIAKAKIANRNSLGYSFQETLLIMVGRFDLAKDQSTLIRAVNQLNRKDVKLLLVGDGPYRIVCEQLVNSLDSESQIMFLGNRTDAIELIKMADIGIISSHWEGFGLVAIEYMACGIPVIGSDVEGLKEVISDYGLLFEKGNHLKLAEKILLLTNNNVEYKKFAEKSLHRAAHFDIQHTADKYQAIYKKMMTNLP